MLESEAVFELSWFKVEGPESLEEGVLFARGDDSESPRVRIF